MKRTDMNQNENSFGIQLNNKCQMSINNIQNNTVMLGSVISTPMHSNSSLLSTALNTPRSNFALLAKPTSSTASFSAIKLVNLSKCQQLSNLNKDNSNVAANNAINVQLVTPIMNNTPISLNDNSNLSHLITKVDNSPLNNITPVVLTSSANQSSSTSNNSITCTRFILHSSQASILPHGTVTIIPQHSDMSPSGLLNNQLIKNARYSLTGMKHTPQAIRPITACSTSVTTQSTLVKQPLSKITPSKSINNYTIMPEGVNTIAIQDLTASSRVTPMSKDQQRCVTKSTPIKPINCTITSSNNIRLALTSSITNSKVNVVNPTKIQLISPKSRKRSGSPTNIVQEGKIKDSLFGLKDENVENPVCYNSQSGSYSPARKRARKQHLKGANHKLQKIGISNKVDVSSVINSIRQSITEKSMPATALLSSSTAKLGNITTQTKSLDVNNANTSIINTNTPQIIIPLKNPIHISKPLAISSHFNNHLNTNNIAFHNTDPCVTNYNQVQIINQTSQLRSIQLSPSNHNLILSPKFTKTLTTFSPQKVIHIAPSKILSNQCEVVKNEKISQESLNKEVENKVNSNIVEKTNVKVEISDIKSEISENLNLKYSLFPYKYHWNARRTHFEKKCDVKVKKRKNISNIQQFNSESPQDKLPLDDIDINDTSWRLHKVCNQFLVQQMFDRENLKSFHKLKEKFDIKPAIITNICDDEPIFQKVTPDLQYYPHLPDQIDCKSDCEFIDPKLFGISEDINSNHINIITEENILSSSSQETKPPQISHSCSETTLFYVTEVPPFIQPPHILRILDLTEGLIVKEKKIIEKESEINNQCLKLIESSECYSNVTDYHNHSESMKVLNGRRW